jgi:hypothetical protein
MQELCRDEFQEKCRAQIFFREKVSFPGRSVFEIGQNTRSIMMSLLIIKGFWSPSARESVAGNETEIFRNYELSDFSRASGWAAGV